MPNSIQLSGKLFEAVQLKNLFPDSKTFVDAIAKYHPEQIIAEYHNKELSADFDLFNFIASNFQLAESLNIEINYCSKRSISEHISYLWGILSRSADPLQSASSSLISLPYPYIVPGGRFSESYYWDSYFSAEGLAADGNMPMVVNMVKNFVFLIETYGLIPNGNRKYYLSRSQPPLLANLLELIFNHSGIEAIATYIPALELEYKFWMNGERAIELSEGVKLNYYWDSRTTPREESYIEDVKLALDIPQPQQANFFRNIRAACESGWDFSSRWLADGKNLATINTCQILPVDLNAILYGMEQKLTAWHLLLNQSGPAEFYQQQATNRQQLFNQYFWNEQQQFYFDYNVATEKQTSVWSLAAVYPLFFKLASANQASAIAMQLEQHFLKAGGVVSSLNETSEQWDSPNGWAPLQWICIVGLRNYAYYELALAIASSFIANVKKVFSRSGKIMEKYNVCDLSAIAGGGEYPLQDGFGWTNGVVSALLKLYPQLA